MRIFIITLLIMASFAAPASSQNLQLHRLFTDHMVLQRGIPAPVHGSGKPGARITVRIGDAAAEVMVAPDGRWTATLPAFPAGGPHVMEVTMDGSDRKQLHDLLFGDVWIASGQSNMDFNVNRNVRDMEKEIAAADFNQIRFFNVPKCLAASPRTDVTGGQWQVCSPQTVGECSAVAYFFAREIFKETGVPVGIIKSAVGGTPIEAWMSATALQRFPNPKQAWLDSLNAPGGNWENLVEENERNIEQLPKQADASMQGLAAGVLDPAFDESKWSPCDLFDSPPKENRIRWLRKHLTLTEPQASAPLTLSLARPGENYIVYINGKKIAEDKGKACRIALPANSFKPGKNLIVIRLSNYWGVPQFGGNPEDAFLGSSDGTVHLPLRGGWKFSDALEPPLPKWLPMADIPSCLFNGMIHPLLQSPVKGAIWYQGEANTGDPAGYAIKLPLLISDWRLHFQLGYFPFLYVQLANYGTPSELPAHDGWPLLREAQARTLALPNTGMAVAIDVGEALDIHPKNKQDVGRRLALQALALTYGGKIESCGPIYRSLERKENRLTLHFDHAAGLGTTDGKTPKGFSVAGEDHVFHVATAVIEGDTVWVSSDKVPQPVAARYGFSSNPVATLVNASGLPASPFRTDDWNQITTAGQ